MRSWLSSTAAILLFCAAGCTLQEPQNAADYLPESDIYYSYADHSGLFRNLNIMADRFHLEILQTAQTEQEKQKWSIFLAALRLAAIQWGLTDGVSSGVSSTRIPDGDPLYHTFRVLATNAPEPGLLWQLPVADGVDIPQTLAKFPADTLLAAVIRVDTAPLARLLRESEKKFPEQARLFPLAKLAKTLSGNWELLQRPGEKGLYFELRLPDQDGILQDQLKTLIRFQPDGTFVLRGDARIPPLSIRLLPGEVRLALAGASAPGQGSLAEDPEMQKRLALLPAKGAGFFYIATEAPWWLNSNYPNSLQRAPRILGVLSVRKNALILQEISDWNAGSETCLLPLIYSPPESLKIGSFLGKKLYHFAVAGKVHNRCQARLLAIRDALDRFRTARGSFPAGNHVEGFRELLQSGSISPENLVCPAATGDIPATDAAAFTADNCSYIYVAGSTAATPEDFPLVFDWPLNHKKKIHVLTVGGRVLTFQAEKLDSCRKVASFLQSRFIYPEKEFRRLLRTAMELDQLFLKGQSK